MPAATTITYSLFGFFRQQAASAREYLQGWLRERERRERADAMARAHTPWQRYWGEEYGLKLKEWMLKPVFEKLEGEGKVGQLIVDVGSGARPVTRFFAATPGRRRILVDVAADNRRAKDEQRIRLNAEKVNEPEALSFRKALLRVCRFLEIEPRSVCRADTMVFADLLNYVDFREVLKGFATYLKPGGRLIIVNLPIRGNESLFSEKGLKDNRQLYEFLEDERFEIEQKSFPCRPDGATDEAEEMIVLVARKA